MQEHDKLRELAILIAVGKLYSEQATFLTGELKYKPKMLYNDSIKTIDKFCNEVEKLLQEDEKQLIQNITDEFHNIFLELRK